MDNEKKLTNINVNEVLEVLNSKEQHHDDAELPEQLTRCDSPDTADTEDTQRRTDIQELLAEGSNSQRKANAVAKPTNRKIKSEEENASEVDQTKSKALEKTKVYPASKSCFFTS